jgi:hypothetical protein
LAESWGKKDMTGLSRRWLRFRLARITIAAIYIFTTFTFPVTHICDLRAADSQARHFANSCHCDSIEPHIYTQARVLSERNSQQGENSHCEALCAACIYSLISRSSVINSATKQISYDIPAHLQSLPDSNIVKQFEWTSSILLRAPPINIS